MRTAISAQRPKASERLLVDDGACSGDDEGKCSTPEGIGAAISKGYVTVRSY